MILLVVEKIVVILDCHACSLLTRIEKILFLSKFFRSVLLRFPIDVASTEIFFREIRFMKKLILVNEFSCYYPISQSKQNVSWESFSGTTEWWTDYKIGIDTYKNVFNINYEPNNNSNSYYRNYWLNDSVGFIKMRELADTVKYVWELQRYRIVK